MWQRRVLCLAPWLLLTPILVSSASAFIDTTPPVWPSGSSITALSITTSSIDIGWTPATDDSGVVNYKVYVNGVWDGMYHMATSFGMQGLTANTSFTFLIVAIDNSSNWSNGPSRTLTTSPPQCAGYAACLVSKFMNDAVASPGGTINVSDKVTNEGQSTIRVGGMLVSGDMGAYSLIPGTEFFLGIGDTTSKALTIPVPANETVGTHSLVFFIGWQYNSTVGWTQGNALVQNSSYSVNRVSQPPGSNTGPLGNLISTLFAYALPEAIAYLGLVAFSVGVVFLDIRRKNSRRADMGRSSSGSPTAS